ncbi:MAG: hypothetical protein KAR42_15575 [candidate division Zixibacteria bacterium]|nr:hypothetical protein [candidate division Zixibacteria bacterium]
MANEYDVIEWADDLGIFDTATPKDQFLKVTEELGEVAECIAKGKPLEDLELELGDLQVTIILLAHLCGTTASKSLDMAYNKIRNRTGRVVNGVFIKDGD